MTLTLDKVSYMVTTRYVRLHF